MTLLYLYWINLFPIQDTNVFNDAMNGAGYRPPGDSLINGCEAQELMCPPGVGSQNCCQGFHQNNNETKYAIMEADSHLWSQKKALCMEAGIHYFIEFTWY